MINVLAWSPGRGILVPEFLRKPGVIAVKRARPETEHILRNAEDTLKTAELGLVLLAKGPTAARISGLRNIVVFGRAFTNVLQNLRSIEPQFDEWYTTYANEMSADPLLRYFYEMRSEILKQGRLRVAISANIQRLNGSELVARFGPAPPNAKAFFVGDSNGGTGWEIAMPDGSTEKYYVDLPSDIGTVTVHFSNAPTVHLGCDIAEQSVVEMCHLFLGYLRRMLAAARKEFGK